MSYILDALKKSEEERREQEERQRLAYTPLTVKSSARSRKPLAPALILSTSLLLSLLILGGGWWYSEPHRGDQRTAAGTAISDRGTAESHCRKIRSPPSTRPGGQACATSG